MARHRRLLGVALAAAALFGLWIAFMPHSPGGVRELADHAGPYAALAVLGVWLVATPSLVSGAVLAAAGGMLLGPLEGSIVTVAGLTLGATAAFVIGRRLGTNCGIARRAAGHRRARAWCCRYGASRGALAGGCHEDCLA